LEFLTIDEYKLLMKELSGGSHVATSVFDEMIENNWSRIAVQDRLYLGQFQQLLSPYELHSVMTIDFV
jgi:hypothetical protein